MTVLDFTDEEKSAGRMGEDRLRAALSALREDGFVVLKGVVDLAHVAALRGRMLEDLEAILTRDDVPYNANRNNVQQDPPPFPPYLFRDVLVNDLVIQVTRALLGPGVKNAFYSGNTALPGEERQPVHPDIAQLWPGLEHATPAFGVVVNVPVVDMTPENGSTEIWPGTHMDTSTDIRQAGPHISEARLAARRVACPPIQPSVEAGSVIIRDTRLWHAGMPNRTGTARPMIAMIHWCGWYGHVDPILFPKGTEAFFEHPELKTVARFVDGPIDYLHHHRSYEFHEEA